jgi:hypothetical protein
VPSVEQAKKLERPEPGIERAIKDGRIRYQYGDGCLSDQLLGQWFADVVGLGNLLAPERIRRTLEAIYRYNFKHNFYDHPNPQRVYALNDDKGLVLCSWPKGGRPQLPFVYSEEVWSGIEYQVAAHLIYRGCLDEGLAIVKAVRERHDGRRRNPWNEVECGSHYARALASWSVLHALAGYHYSAPERLMTFKPLVNGRNFNCFFTAGSGWGVFSQVVDKNSFTIKIESRYGETHLRHLRLGNEANLTGVTVQLVKLSDGRALTNCNVTVNKAALEIDLGQEITIAAGRNLSLRLLAR